MSGPLRSSVKFDGVAEIESRIARAASKAEHVLAIQIRNDTSPFVPKRTGSLDGRTLVNGNAVIYPGPYARFLYGGKVMLDPVTGSSYARPRTRKVLTDKPLKMSKAGHAQATDHWFEAAKRQYLPAWERVAAEAVRRAL